MRILAGDIGGTKTDLLLRDVDRGGRACVDRASARYRSADYPDLEAILRDFLGDADEPVEAAAFGVAGPVVDGVCRTTNLPWTIDRTRLAAQLGLALPRLHLLNDFHALSLAVEHLGEHQLEILQAGEPEATGPRALIGAGTGLGEAILIPTAEGPRVLATEGGHVDFAPRDALEIRLLEHLADRYGHVSYERVVSGLGVAALYEFIVDDGVAPSSPAVEARLRREDPAAVIGELALKGEDSACVATIDRFLRIYGAAAGNLALKVLPTGGLFIAGGIAPRLLPLLRSGPFLQALLAKGRMRRLLERIPIAVVTEPRAGLLGAAQAALQRATRGPWEPPSSP